MYVFDCDGVVLNSNEIKNDAFRVALVDCPPWEIDAFLTMHRATAGVSRFVKFEWMANRARERGYQFCYSEAIKRYAAACRQGLLTAEVAPDLTKARNSSNEVWAIVSGGDQQEVRDVLEQKGIASYFDGGIFGSPRNKTELLTELSKGQDMGGSIFFGDSAYDHDSAVQFEMEFHFVWGWTEMKDWQSFCHSRITVSATHRYVTDYFGMCSI